MAKLLLGTALVLLACLELGSAYRLVCYFTNWAQYRPGAGKYTVDNVDPCLCTHLIYAFAGMKDNQITTFEWNDRTLYHTFNSLKNKNANLKTLLSIGGWNFGTQKFTAMVSSAETRQIFIKSVINFLRGYGFDGLDIDWEYPGSQVKHLFTLLAQEMVAAFEAEGKSTGRPRLLLSAAVPAGLAIIDSSYEVPELGKTLDFFNVMTYDFTGSGSPKTGENSPLFPLPNSKSYANVHFNVDYAMKIWIDKGAPAEKLNVGFATYGHTFILTTSETGIGAPAGGPAPAGKYTKQSGVLSYYEICTFLKDGTMKWDAPQMVPYGYKGNVWVGYDNVQSFKDKVEWLKKNNYGGAMVWTLGMDDFSGSFCDEGPYPLMNALHTGLGISASCVPSKTTLRPAVPPTQAPSGGGSSGSGGSGFCAGKANGVYADPKAKNKFYQCVNGVTYLKNCAVGLVFDPSCDCCNWP
ncbi:acidic mammalian chitinase-like [Hemiscyllium ocellatum]|uniref:acidic mammalian chitinase-like n=1 Tax=Hemiscyllium ocellatum TaxID=170820 RepID=UPI002966C054|nr:acidic mammalian chitinase-like [Hemiscyllium ocellatum]